MHYLTSRNLESPGIVHGFFTRLGGVSSGLYDSLNCAFSSGDRPENVVMNRERIAMALGDSVNAICTNMQIHGTEVTRITKDWQPATSSKADAFVTNEPGYALSILTADCVPVLLHDPDARVIGAAHAGWKGALSGMIAATVNAMEGLGAKRSQIIAATGPAIQQDSYEVGPEVRAAFIENTDEFASFFIPSERADHFQFDLPGIVEAELVAARIADIDVSGTDTYQDTEQFFSYRRSTHLGEADYGRAISSIALV